MGEQLPRPAAPAPAAAKTVTRMPRPRAPPRWWATLTSPPATPASFAATPAMPPVVSALSAEALTDAEDDHRQRDAGQVGRVGPTRLSPAVPISIAATPATARRSLPSRRLSREVTVAATRSGGRHREESQAGLQRRVVADALEVLGHEEVELDQHAVEQEAGGVGAGAAAVGEQAQRHEGLRGARLPETKSASSSAPSASATTSRRRPSRRPRNGRCRTPAPRPERRARRSGRSAAGWRSVSSR